MNRSERRSRIGLPGARLSRYLVSEMWLPSLLATAAFGLVVLLTDLLAYADLIVNRGLGVREVGELALLQLIPTLARTLPFAVLLGILVGLGRLAADRELLALEASGFSPRQLAVPGLLFAIVATGLSVYLSVVLSPDAQRHVRDRMLELTRDRPGLSLRPGVASNLDGWRIEARRIDDSGAELEGVLVYMPSLDETIFSKHGTILEPREDASTARSAPVEAGGDADEPALRKRMVLEDGLILFNSEDRASVLRFDRLETPLPATRPDKGLPVDLASTLPFRELVSIGREDGGTTRGRLYLGEAHRRIALGVAALPFGLLAMGLALGQRTLSRSSGIAMGIGGAIAYYALFQLSEGLLRSDSTPVALAIWLPDIVLAAVALALLVFAGRRTSAGDRGSGKGERGLLERFGIRREGLRVKRFALPRYVAGQFLQIVAACIAGLVLAYLIIDVFDNLKWFNRYGATADAIVKYYVARLPVLASRVIPMALLIAVALTISVLGANGELLGMRACGLPILRILAPLWILCALAVPADHLLTTELVPRAVGISQKIKKTDIKGERDASQVARELVWYRVGRRIHEMGLLDLPRGIAEDVTLYEIGKDGLPLRRTDAAQARFLGEGNWLLDEPRTVELREGKHLDRLPRADHIAQFGDEAPAELETADLTPADLRARLARPDLEPPAARVYRTDLQMKLAAPFACLLLPLIALFFAATGPPFPRPVQMLIASALIAVVHAIATSFAGSMGQGGSLPPWLAGWGPSLLFGLVAIAMGIRQRIRSQTAG
ncbi:MAG: LptF/LptG family permease [Myxococcota bacterium]